MIKNGNHDCGCTGCGAVGNVTYTICRLIVFGLETASPPPIDLTRVPTRRCQSRWSPTLVLYSAVRDLPTVSRVVENTHGFYGKHTLLWDLR